MEELCSRRNLIAAFLFFVAYLLVNGYVLMRLGFHSDEVLDFRGEATWVYAAAGRWGNALYRVLMHGGAIPFAAGVAAGVYLSLAYLVQVSVLQLRSAASFVVYGAVCFGLVQFPAFETFSSNVDAVACGMLLVSSSVYVLQEKSGRIAFPFFAAAVLLTLGLAMYQTLVSVYAVICLAVYLLRKEQSRDLCAGFFLRRAILVGIVSCLLYGLFHKGLRYSGLIPEDFCTFADSYQAKFSLPWSAFAAFPWEEKIRFLGHIAKEIFFHCLGLQYEGEWLYATCIIPLCILSRRYFLVKYSVRDFAFRLFILLAMWVLPHIFLFYFVNFPGPRILLAEPLACASLWGLALRPIVVTQRKTMCIVLVALVVLIKASFTVSSAAYAERLKYDNSVDTMRHIYYDARRASSEAGGDWKNREIVLVDSVYHLGDEAARPYGKDVYLAHLFSRVLGLPLFRCSTEEEVTSELKFQMRGLSPWPASGCYLITPDKVYVKVAGWPVNEQLFSLFIRPFSDPRMKAQ